MSSSLSSSNRIAALVASAAGLGIIASGAFTGVAAAAGPNTGPSEIATPAVTPPPGPGAIATPEPTTPPAGPDTIAAPEPTNPPAGPGGIANPQPPTSPNPGAGPGVGPGEIAAPEPKPTNPGGIADKPPVSSGAILRDFTAKPVEAFSFTYNWTSNRKTSLFQASTAKFTKKDGLYSLPASAETVKVTGTKIGSGKGGDLAGGAPNYRFTHTVTGTQPSTVYSVLVSVPLSDAFLPVQRAWTTTTKAPPALPPAQLKSHLVSVKVTQIKVIKDGDTGLRGKGEVSFGVRLAPDADATIPSNWGDFTHGPDGYFKAKNGQTLNLTNALTHDIVTTKNKALVEVQGLENDVDVFEGFCPLGAWENVTAREFSDNCYDASVARALVSIPAKKGSSKQTVTATVPGSPGLSFEAQVEVTTSAA